VRVLDFARMNEKKFFPCINNAAILLLAGSGERFSGDKLKQYYPIKGVPLFLYATKALLSSPDVDFLLLVVKQGEIERTKEYLSSFKSKKQYAIIEGGKSREESSFLGVKYFEPFLPKKILIHDGDRPFLTAEMIHSAFVALNKHESVIFASRLTDSVYRIDLNMYENRDNFYAVSTPQAFQYQTLLLAMKEAKSLTSFTDDASIVLEILQKAPFIIENDNKNMKLTSQSDITLLEAVL